MGQQGRFNQLFTHHWQDSPVTLLVPQPQHIATSKAQPAWLEQWVVITATLAQDTMSICAAAAALAVGSYSFDGATCCNKLIAD